MGMWGVLISNQVITIINILLLIKNIYLGVLIIVVLLGSNPARDKVVPHGVGQGKVVVSRSSDISIFHQSVMHMTIERPLHLSHIFYCYNTSHRDLLPLVGIGLYAHLGLFFEKIK